MGFDTARARLVERLRGEGIVDEAVLRAIGRVPRHRFVAPDLAEQAYANEPLPIGQGQTISQPLIVAMMTQALGLTGAEIVLEIGTGSGYQAAILAEMGHPVVSVERDPDLAASAAALLPALEYTNVQIVIGDGTLGWPQEAPYSAILVAAGAPRVPAALTDQLVDGGRLVIPVGSRYGQTLRLISREGADLLSTGLGLVRFVPLVGQDGWPPEPDAEGEA
jgi:protein-L-isoaspartate(D-aspartate) O-methyltransferase